MPSFFLRLWVLYFVDHFYACARIHRKKKKILEQNANRPTKTPNHKIPIKFQMQIWKNEWNGMEWIGLKWNEMKWSGVEWNWIEAWSGLEHKHHHVYCIRHRAVKSNDFESNSKFKSLSSNKMEFRAFAFFRLLADSRFVNYPCSRICVVCRWHKQKWNWVKTNSRWRNAIDLYHYFEVIIFSCFGSIEFCKSSKSPPPLT